MLNNKRILAMLLLALPVLSGCWDQKIFEETGFILNVAVESAPDNKMLVTMTYPYISTIESNQVELISTTADSLREARTKIRRESSRTLAAGKIQQVLFSEEFAHKGIHGAIEIFERDPENSLLPWIVVVEGSPQKMLQSAKNFLNKPRPAIYLNQLLEATVKETYIPNMRVYKFDVAYFADGLDPIAPIIKLVPGGIRVVGNALFKEDRMVGRINTTDYALLSLIENVGRETTHIIVPQQMENDVPIGNKSMVLIVKKCKSKVNTIIIDSVLKTDIKIELLIDIEDYMWDDLDKPEKQQKVEQYLSIFMKGEISRLLEYIKATGSDPIGIGDKVRAGNNTWWKSNNWDAAYEDMLFSVDVNVKIGNYGIIN